MAGMAALAPTRPRKPDPILVVQAYYAELARDQAGTSRPDEGPAFERVGRQYGKGYEWARRTVRTWEATPRKRKVDALAGVHPSTKSVHFHATATSNGWIWHPPTYGLDIITFKHLPMRDLSDQERTNDLLLLGMALLAVISTAPLWRTEYQGFALVMTVLWSVGVGVLVWSRWRWEWRGS